MGDDEKIHVLIVDDIAETRENIRKLLQFENEIEVSAVARNGHEGIQIAREIKPDVILMDINMPDMDGIAATEIIHKDVPHCQIVMLSVQGDPNYMRRAMLAGARDFLTKPPTVDELTSAVLRAGEMAKKELEKSKTSFPVQMGSAGFTAMSVPGVTFGKVIAVYSPKGGTGCTTIVTNLAVTLHNEETPVVLVDGNLQFGDVAVFLNEQGKNNVIDLTSRADELDPEIVNEVLINHTKSGLKILAAPISPEQADSATGEEFRKVLKYLRTMFSYVLVDTSSILTDITIAAMDESDVVILLTTQDIPAIKDARLFLDIATALDIQRERILFVMNRYDKRIGITPEKISENFKHEIVATLPAEERAVIPSINRGLPIMLGDRSRPIAKSFFSLAEVLRERLTKLETAEEAFEPSKNGK
jgi:pilus assembly protein CpaE